MSWGVITGDQSLLPQSGNEVQFEAGKPKRIRLLLQPGEEPYSFFQHTFEVEKVENGQTTSVFRTSNCPKTTKTPFAPCKLCDGQQAKRRVRSAANCWDYDTGSVRKLVGGEKIWKPIATLVKMGIDVTTIDFAITKTGETRNDTDYTVVNIGASAFQLPEGAVLYNIEQEYRPHTEEEAKSLVGSLGLSWDSMIVPPALVYPTSLDEALNHVIPNTKYKGQTMKQVFETNKGMIEYFSNSSRMTPEKAYAQVILVALAGAVIDGVPNLAVGNQPASNVITQTPPVPQGNQSNPPAPPVQQPIPAQQPIQTPVQSVAPVQPASTVGTADRQAKINQINQALQTNPKFVSGGYQVIIDTMKQATMPNPKVSINEFTDAEVDKMLELCK